LTTERVEALYSTYSFRASNKLFYDRVNASQLGEGLLQELHLWRALAVHGTDPRLQTPPLVYTLSTLQQPIPQWLCHINHYGEQHYMSHKMYVFIQNWYRLITVAQRARTLCDDDCYAVHMRPDVIFQMPVVFGSNLPHPHHFPGDQPRERIENWRSKPMIAAPACSSYNGISDQFGILNAHLVQLLAQAGMDVMKRQWWFAVPEEPSMHRILTRVLGVVFMPFHVNYMFLRPRYASFFFHKHLLIGRHETICVHPKMDHTFVPTPPSVMVDWLLCYEKVRETDQYKIEPCLHRKAQVFERALRQAAGQCHQLTHNEDEKLLDMIGATPGACNGTFLQLLIQAVSNS